MLFSTLLFLWVFFPFVFIGTCLIKSRYTNIFLLICSLVFYAWGEPRYILLMLFSIIFNYRIAMIIERYNGPKRKAILILAILINLGMLGIFKYLDFLVDTVNTLYGGTLLHRKNIPLPIGISFYTFQALSYVVDVYKKNVFAQKKFINLALYISFFPQLIAGPIVQYKDISMQLDNRWVTPQKRADGFFRFFCGLGKKVLLSNTMASIADSIFALDYFSLGTLSAWLGIVSYTLQIYFDFSGYSDMAIGLGKIFGFDFLENFNLPYMADSIKNFWQRWHISLSSWFKEYLYIPLGGNRKSTLRTYCNHIIVFFATGIWHGASWNFVIWGFIHGFFLILEKSGLTRILNKAPKSICHAYTLLVISIAWVFFRVEELSKAIQYIKSLFIPTTGITNIWMYIGPKDIFVLFIAIFFCGIHKKIWDKYRDTRLIRVISGRGVMYSASLLIYILSIMALASGMYNPFIYFRF